VGLKSNVGRSNRSGCGTCFSKFQVDSSDDIQECRQCRSVGWMALHVRVTGN
jgi:PHP family Zn ribbon phosphoesterase